MIKNIHFELIIDVRQSWVQLIIVLSEMLSGFKIVGIGDLILNFKHRFYDNIQRDNINYDWNYHLGQLQGGIIIIENLQSPIINSYWIDQHDQLWEKHHHLVRENRVDST